MLESAGHDISTVALQNLCGTQDETLFATCAAEGCALITLDHDSILNRLREFLAVLQAQTLGSELWIVEPGRVRIHQSEDAS